VRGFVGRGRNSSSNTDRFLLIWRRNTKTHIEGRVINPSNMIVYSTWSLYSGAGEGVEGHVIKHCKLPVRHICYARHNTIITRMLM
jgi:hypothetical protein